ncbi:anaerobic sulfatase maturase [Jinshanibacter sp. LJY008]|uniref:Anaerobic sulfatase maturase n=1 Tax=Limnobaculum eriocheiris TaxID=2897391 RepID=A0A9X1MX19_9GAMM|nr:anaerobic sulfatase maturase [Limnobaculum eriocheiris]MCD1125337.1 anaerobic sulfatase maturase [Limnobaculum eriocheiris]
MAKSHLQPTQFHMMAKPVSYRCNLKCDYCFYLSKEGMMAEHSSERMSDSMLKRYVRDYISSQDTKEIDFAWQGGEPTLAGLDFYRQVVKYQKMFAEGKNISNSFQTNAVAINRQWAEFFYENNFLIGVSIDGIPEIHDRYRVSVNGQPTFERIKHSIDLLKEYQINFNTLTVVNDRNWNKGKETYLALKALGSEFIQFIPIVEIDAQQGERYSPDKDARMAPFSVPAHGYGQFMTDVFNEWIKKDVGKVFVRMFDSLLAMWLGYPSPLCILSKECGQALVIEANGDIYSCDHYVYPANKLGNIAKTQLSKLATSKQQRRFGNAKYGCLTNLCHCCEFHGLCYGGCPKHRILTIEGEKHKQNYLCSSYKHIFEYTAPAMHMMVEEIQRGGIAAHAVSRLLKLYSH